MNGGVSGAFYSNNLVSHTDTYNGHVVQMQGNDHEGVTIWDNCGFRDHVDYHQFVQNGYNRVINGRQIHILSQREKEAKKQAKSEEKQREKQFKGQVKEQKRLEKERAREEQRFARDNERDRLQNVAQRTHDYREASNLSYPPPSVHTSSFNTSRGSRHVYSRRSSFTCSGSFGGRILILVSLLALAFFQIRHFVKHRV